MSNFPCKCGHIIGFNVFPLRYDGHILRDAGYEALHHHVGAQVADFLAAVQAGRRQEWLDQFYADAFEIADTEVVSDILTRHLTPLTIGIHQCERCGRVYLGRADGENVWASYLPERDDWRGALETPAEGFVCYVAGQNFYEARISGMNHEDNKGEAWVLLVGSDGSQSKVAFSGVTAVRVYDGAISLPVRFLSEWRDVEPLRRFVFDSADQRSEPLIEVTAREVVVLL